MSLRIGLIGAGYWGARLLRVFRGLDGVEVVLAVDGDPAQRAAVAAEVRVAADVDALWSDASIDAALVATPPSSHFALARAALAAGKHCWVEKPLALHAGHARQLVELAARQRRTLFVDETFLYDPLVQRAREWILGDRLGRVLHLSFERLGMGRIRRDSDVWWNSAPHDLSILRYFVAAAVEAIHVERFAYLQPGIADMCVGTVRFAGGVSAHIYLSWLSPQKRASVVVVGARGMLVYEGRFEQRALTFYDYVHADPAAVQSNVVPIERFAAAETITGGAEEPLALAAAAFVHAVRTGAPAPSDGRSSLKVVELLEAGNPSP
jgi:UDP-2-acetamido-3-amino-2,3-dideoxy-glucuronate N-acetyltransferase